MTLSHLGWRKSSLVEEINTQVSAVPDSQQESSSNCHQRTVNPLLEFVCIIELINFSLISRKAEHSTHELGHSQATRGSLPCPWALLGPPGTTPSVPCLLRGHMYQCSFSHCYPKYFFIFSNVTTFSRFFRKEKNSPS